MVRRLARMARAFALGAVLASGAPLPGRAADLLVFAAASLKGALDEVAESYRQSTGTRVAVSYAASSALARQIERGAPADLFISADTDWMDYLAERGLVAQRDDLWSNEIVVIAPAAAAAPFGPGRHGAWSERLGAGRLAMADPAAVPAGKYARAALETLGVWAEVADRLARAENVRAALAFVARGEAPLGIVYASDAAAEPAVRTVALLPPESHPPIVYPAAVLAGSRHPGAAGFFAALASPEVGKVLERHGFKLRLTRPGH
jgi:molybdate transport system substrate-binding protein